MKKFYAIIVAIMFVGISIQAQQVRNAHIVKTMPKVEITNFDKTPTDTLMPDNAASGSPVMYGAQGGGYVVGNNNYGDEGSAQEYWVLDPSESYAIEGAMYWFGAKELVGGTGTVTAKVWAMDGSNGSNTTSQGDQVCPGTVLASKTENIADIDTAMSLAGAQITMFDAPITVTSNYAIGFDVTSIGNDTVGLVCFDYDPQLSGAGPQLELSWSLNSNYGGWNTFQYAWGGLDIDLAVFPIVDATVAGINDNRFLFGMKLSQNYPNPTANECLIEYALESNSDDVVFTIFDLTGKKVMEIEEGKKEAGNHEIKINAAKLASGTYIYSISSNGKKLVKKMTINK